MSKSLDFCKEISQDKNRSTFTDRNWTNVYEVDSFEFFRQAFDTDCCDFYVSGHEDEDNKKVDVRVILDFNADTQYEYFTSYSEIHDGSIAFEHDLMVKCLSKVGTGNSLPKDLNIKNYHDGDVVKYTIGNFVIITEHDEDGNKFTPDDKPFCNCRTTVMLPLAVTMGKNVSARCERSKIFWFNGRLIDGTTTEAND